MSQTLTTPSADPDARYVDVGSTLHTWTGASWVFGITRSGWTTFLASGLGWSGWGVGSVKIRRASDPEKTRRYFEQGDTARELIGSVSFTHEKNTNTIGQRTHGRYVAEAQRRTKRTPAKRQCSLPNWMSVRMTCSPTQVITLVPSGVRPTGPAVCKGPMTLCFS